jgi:hygromycin-B 7''-O-kinase
MSASSGLLPAGIDRIEYERLHPLEEPWLEAVRAICQRHDLPSGQLERRLDGGNVVYFAGASRVIKLFAPMWRREHAAERAVLERVSGRLPAATPDVCACDDIDGWPYFVLTRVPGQPAAESFAELPRADQQRLAADLGDIAAHLRELPIDGLDDLGVDWPAFVAERKARCVAEHRARGAPERLVAALQALVDGADVLDAGPTVLLHADLADVNVLLARAADGPRISGIIDFGDAFVGAAEYELVTPAEFFFTGRPDLLVAFLRGYGCTDHALNDRFARRLMALTVLHRFGNVGRLATRTAARAGVLAAGLTLEQLAALAYDFGSARP